MSQLVRDKIDYIVACVNEFSDAHGLTYVDGFDYLRNHAGIDFLDRHYAVEHAYSIEEALSDLSAVCRCHFNSGSSTRDLSRSTHLSMPCNSSISTSSIHFTRNAPSAGCDSLGLKMSAEVRQLIEFAVQDLVAEIVSREGLSIEEAMDALYHSPFFKKVADPATGLYRESGEYLYAAMRQLKG